MNNWGGGGGGRVIIIDSNILNQFVQVILTSLVPTNGIHTLGTCLTIVYINNVIMKYRKLIYRALFLIQIIFMLIAGYIYI